ncbi:MAG: phosphate ABC transporter permease subunit PstC [Pseudomonadota bacterium]
MHTGVLLGTLLLLMVIGYFMGRSRATAVAHAGGTRLHSITGYYGFYVALWCGLPALAIVAVWSIAQPWIADWALMSSLPAQAEALAPEKLVFLVNDLKAYATGLKPADQIPAEMLPAVERYQSVQQIAGVALWVVVGAAAIAGLAYARRHISPQLRARNQVERVANLIMVAASGIAILVTFGIVLSLLFEAIRFFGKVPITEFLFGLQWSPQTALREDQVGSTGAFGAIPLFAGTLLITFIAMCVAVPIGLLSAIYLSEYAGPKLRAFAKPALEVLAGVPTVVYGFFAALTIAPWIRNTGESIGLEVSSESGLAAGLVMGMMIIPFVSSLSDDVINAVPQSLRDGAYGLGATKSETIKQVIIPAALPGIVGGVLLAVSRAIGETMIVVMAAGLAANLTANPLEAVTTVTVQIVTLLVGDQEFDSAKTLAAFALGLTLFVVTLSLNLVALHVVRKYREKYD